MPPNASKPTSTSTAPTPPSSSASISIREYIYLLPYPLPPHTPTPYTPGLPARNPLRLPAHPFEPTSTLVLTSPLKTFVDLRFLRPSTPFAPQLPNRGEAVRLECGFAGKSTSRAISDPSGGGWAGTTHGVWTAFVDSRFEVGSTRIPVDEGVMYPVDRRRTLECGHAWHASVGGVRSHEEMWGEEDITATGGDGKRRCVVLRCRDDGVGVRGVVIRLGKWCQGVVKVGGGAATVERWEWVGETDGWKRVARVGDLMVPCAVAVRQEVLVVGGKVKYGAFEWGVEEVWEWD